MRKKKHIVLPDIPWIEELWKAMKAGKPFTIDGIGTFTAKKINGRKTYNPATGGEAYMEPYIKIKFKVSTDLFSYINE